MLLLLAACGAPEVSSESPSAQREEIINGRTDTTDTGAAMLYVQFPDGSGYLCSGSVIAPHTFLTAAHCTAEFGPGAIAVVTNATDAIKALENPLPDGGPNYSHIDAMEAYPAYHQAGGNDWHDIGIAHIVEAQPGPYIPVNRYPLERLVVLGQPVREVGYGITAGNADGGQGEGTRRSVTKYDTQVLDPGELESGDQAGLTCSGDSGGPALFVTPDGLTSVIGVTSRGDDACQKNGIDTRPDPYLDWIEAFEGDAGDLPSCGADGVCGFHCPAPDPDCPCAPDGFCTSACTNPAADPDCPESCLYDGGTCIPPPKTAAPPPPPAQKSGCQGVEGLSMLSVLVTALSLARRKRRPGHGAPPVV